MRRARLIVATLIAVAATAALSSVVFASVNDVRLGNFYYEDATVGDGKIEIRQGDQLRFITEDNGPGTPHTVEVDELGIHSGGLSTGQTYTTPVINQTGTFTLYCKFHENRGHVTTLVVRPSTTTTTPPATTTTTTRPATTTTAATATTPSTSSGTTPTSTNSPGTTNGVGGSPTSGSDPTTTAGDGETDEPTADGEAATDDDPTSVTDANEGSDVDPSATVPSGLGQLPEDELAAIPAAEGSLESILGRAPAQRGPWTRSIRMALLGAIPLVALAALAERRHRKHRVAAADAPPD